MSEESNQQKPVKVWRKKNIHLVNEENDIKFRGPISYRYLRVAGWIFLFIAQLGVILSIASSAKLININPSFLTVIKGAGSLMTPLFLFAAFSQVLVAKDGYRRLVTVYGLGSIGLFLLFLIVYLHFGVGLFRAITGSWDSAFETVNALITGLTAGGFTFNIFIDLLLCTLVTFFINYQPTEHFQGKKIYLFRAFVAIPILYELASIVVKLLTPYGLIGIHPLVIPLLTTKPPVAFLIFVFCALFVKSRERHYIKHGKTHEEYKDFLHTNVNRLHFALFLVTAVIGGVILDTLLFVVISIIKVAIFPVTEDPELMEQLVLNAFASTYATGFGACLPMLLIIPLLIFFDYTKTHENKMMDIIIPVAGIVLLILLYIEGLFEISKGYIADLVKKAQEAEEENPPANPAIMIIDKAKELLRK